MSRTAREVIANYLVGEESTTEVIDALDAAGFVIVPKEPTELQYQAASNLV